MNQVRRSPPRGFTLLEVLIAMTVLMVVMGALLFTLTRMETVSHQQLTITDVQQSARAAHDEVLRMVRMAGRGGLQQDSGFLGRALVIRNNVGTGGVPREIAADSADSPLAVTDTDVVIVRGVLTSDLIAVDYRDPSTSDWNAAAGIGSVTISRSTPTGLGQDVSALVDANNAGIEEAIILIDAVDASTYGVARLIPGALIDAGDTEIRLRFDTMGGHGPQYAQLSRNFDGSVAFPQLNAVAFIGVLEEYRYYVRDDEDLGPTMSRARVFPNTESPYDNDEEQLVVDFAVGVADLQVALAFDSSFEGSIDDDDDAVGPDDQISEFDRDDSLADDWLFNQTADDPTDPVWSGPWIPEVGAIAERPTLFAVRVSTLAMARTIERGHMPPPLEGLEDRIYTTDVDDPINGDPHRLKRKRLLQTVVKPRNL